MPNIDAMFAVYRNCHSSPPSGAPVALVTFAQISDKKTAISDKLTANTMPPPGSGFTISANNKAAILAWIAAGAVGVPYANGICP